MPVNRTQGEVCRPAVKDQEGMLRLIKKYRLIPFFVNPVPGFSIEEHTPSEFWLTEENLGRLNEIIPACLEDPRFREGRDLAREQSWTPRGDAAARTADFMIRKRRELLEKEANKSK